MTGEIAVSLPRQQIAIARRAVAAGRAASVSAYVPHPLERWDADERLAKDAREDAAEGGSASSADRAWARHGLRLDGTRELPWSLAG